VSTIPIKLSKLFPDIDWQDTKVHIAQRSGVNRPIDDFVDNFETWQNTWTGGFHSRNCWSRTYVFSMMEVPGQTNQWLFGGVFEVVSRTSVKQKRTGKVGVDFTVKLATFGLAFIGRLMIEWEKDARTIHRLAETILDGMRVLQVLPEPYAGEAFPGSSNINHNFRVLERIWRDERSDWKAALQNCQGIYLITDTLTNHRYIGSASGEEGIWSRWSAYLLYHGHADNTALKAHLNSKKDSINYARENFTFSLLEYMGSSHDKAYILDRESHWKEVLLTRNEKGLNEN